MQLTLEEGLPFISMLVGADNGAVTIERVLVDTGSASRILAAHVVEQIRIQPQLDDTLYLVRGLGGMETVYARRIPSLTIDQVTLRDFEAEIGGMAYGFPIDGILGMDVLTTTGALIDLQRLSIEFASAP